MRVLRTLQKDASFAKSVEHNEVLRSIALRRLNGVETSAVEAPDHDDLSQVKTTHGEVLWMLGARHACDALAVRIAKESFESPAVLAGLLGEAREALSDARPMADQLLVWRDHEELGPTYTRFAAAVAELEAEVARFDAIADSLFVGTDLDPSRPPPDQRLTEWGWVLGALSGSMATCADPAALQQQARALTEGLIARFAESAERDRLRSTVKSYDRVLLVARARGLATNDEALCRAAEQAHRSTREVLERLLPSTAEEVAAEREARDSEFAQLTQATGSSTPWSSVFASSRGRVAATVALLVIVAIGAGAYGGLLRPTFNYETLTQEQVRALWPELLGGYVVARPGGKRLFIGYLARQDRQAPTAMVAQVSQKVLHEMGPRGVGEVLILDRNNVPIGLMQGGR